MIGNVGFADLFSSVLKQVLGEFSCFAVVKERVIFGSNGFPRQDSLCCVLRDGGPKISTIFVTWDVQVPKLLCLFKLDSMFIDHLWCPPDSRTQSSGKRRMRITATTSCDPEQRHSSLQE